MSDTAIIRAGLQGFRPPEIIRPSDFVERELRLPASTNAIPGRLRLSGFQREIVDAIADPEVETIVLMLASQIGKSLAIESQIMAMIATSPGPMLHVSADLTAVEKFVRTRFDPLVEASPLLRGLVGKGQATRKGSSGGVNSITEKSFPGGSITFVSSRQPTGLASQSVRFAWMDEVDRFAASAGKEGTPDLLAAQRTERYALSGRKIVLVSTPTGRFSRIHEWFKKGDQRKFHVRCGHCETEAPITWENLHWSRGKPETAALTCGKCGVVHSEASRMRMLQEGRWIPTADGGTGIRSYHMTALGSEYTSLKSLAQKWEETETVEDKQVFFNVKLGEPFDSSIEMGISSLELRQRAEPVTPPYSESIEFVTVGVDVQDNRLEAQLVGHCRNDVSYILNHLRKDGNTYDREVWEWLDDLIGGTVELEDGRRLPILVTGVDSGHRPDAVIDFIFGQARKSRRVVALKGVGGFNRPFIRAGGKLKQRLGLQLVGTDSVKAWLYSRFRKVEYGPGYIHIPDHLPDEFYAGLASESIETVYVNGFPRKRFIPSIKGNEALDACVYAHATAGLVDRQSIRNPPASKQFDAEAFKQQVAAFAKQTRG